MKRLLRALVGTVALGVCALAPARALAQSNPHDLPSVPGNESFVAPDLPPGSIEATILDAKNQPIRNTQVRLGIMFQKISEGESRSEKFAVSDEAGRVRFSGLQTGSEYAYRVTLQSGPASYGSSPFNLGASAGHRVRLHVFPVTTDIERAAVGMRGLVYVETRDDVFQFEVLHRVFNVGATTWVPSNVVMRLPGGFKAFSAQREMSGVGFVVVDGVGARLDGTFPPGQFDVRFRFQMPKSSEQSASFRLGLLPHTADIGVFAEASSRMGLRVEGFRDAVPDTNPQGKRVLVARKNFARDEREESYAIELTGLPVPGPGRWIAVLLASALGLTGLAAYRGLVQLESGGKERRNRDLENARELLLDEIVEVEQARRSGELGPRAYANARRVLLESLARLGRDTLTVEKRPRKKV